MLCVRYSGAEGLCLYGLGCYNAADPRGTMLPRPVPLPVMWGLTSSVHKPQSMLKQAPASAARQPPMMQQQYNTVRWIIEIAFANLGLLLLF